MARNYIQPGETITATAPTGGVVAGLGYLIGSLFLVARASIAEALPFEGATEGVFDLAKVGSQAWTEGDKIYWDAGNAHCTTVATAGPLIGTATLPVPGSGAGETTGRVRLCGCAPAIAEGAQAAIADLTFGTNIAAATANGALADSSATNPTDAQFNELAKELGVKINAILAALRTTGIVAS